MIILSSILPVAVDSNKHEYVPQTHFFKGHLGTSTTSKLQNEVDFMTWVARLRERQKFKQSGGSGYRTSEYIVDQPEDYAQWVTNPSTMRWLDWKPVLTPKTFIIVDANGGGDFRTITEAIDSIPRDMFRPYRITVQVNAGVYR